MASWKRDFGAVIVAKRVGTNEALQRQIKSEQISKKKPGRIILLILLLIGTLFYGYKKIDFNWIKGKVKPLVSVKGVKVEGCISVDSAIIADAFSLDMTQTVTEVNTDSLKKIIESINGIDKVEMQMGLSRELIIKVKEKVPVAYTIIEGSLYFTDRKGELWPFKPGSYRDIPVIVGVHDSLTEDGIQCLVKEDLKRFKRVTALFRNAGRLNSLLTLDFINRDMITLSMKGIGPKVRIASYPEEYVLKNIDALFSYIKRKELKVKEYIDLSYRDVAFIR